MTEQKHKEEVEVMSDYEKIIECIESASERTSVTLCQCYEEIANVFKQPNILTTQNICKKNRLPRKKKKIYKKLGIYDRWKELQKEL